MSPEEIRKLKAQTLETAGEATGLHNANQNDTVRDSISPDAPVPGVSLDAPASEGVSPEVAPESASKLPQGIAVKKEPVEPPAVINSSTNRKEYMVLKRLCESGRVDDFPNIKRVFDGGSRAEKQALLANWVKNGQDAQAVEGLLKVRASQKSQGEARQELLTVAAMRRLGMSE